MIVFLVNSKKEGMSKLS